MKAFNRICLKCGNQFSTYSPSGKYCSLECSIDSFTIPGRPKHLMISNTPCKIWRGDFLDGKPVVVGNNGVEEVRKLQVNVPEGKRINTSCGNKNCVNKDHYDIVDDLSDFGYF